MKVDEIAAARLATKLEMSAVDEATLVTEAFALHRREAYAAAISDMIIEMDAALPGEDELWNILWSAGKSNQDKARAVLAALPDPVRLRDNLKGGK